MIQGSSPSRASNPKPQVSTLPTLPPLATLARKPSWVNNAGRVDRAACMEIRASELWPLLDSHCWTELRSSTGRLAYTTVTIDAPMLARLHDTRSPRLLLGDLRTPKSNAMKGPHDPYRRRYLNRGAGDQPWTALDDALDIRYSNPNKGATRTKRLALWDTDQIPYHTCGPWKQEVRIEKWIRDKKKGSVVSSQWSGKHQSSRDPNRKSSIVNRKLISPPNHWHYLICPACDRKVFKLFMVLALPQEVEDAEIAEGWIKMLDARSNARGHGGTGVSPVQLDPDLLKTRAALIARYGLLFRSRRMTCKKCLGIRYGEVRGKSKTVDPAKAAARAQARELKRARHNANVEARSQELLHKFMEPRIDTNEHE